MLALQLPIDHVWQILTDTTGLGATGEILTAERIDNIARITTPLRNRNDAAFELTIPLTVEKAIAARQRSSDNHENTMMLQTNPSPASLPVQPKAKAVATPRGAVPVRTTTA